MSDDSGFKEEGEDGRGWVRERGREEREGTGQKDRRGADSTRTLVLELKSLWFHVPKVLLG